MKKKKTSKIVSLKKLVCIVKDIRKRRRKIVHCHGCFDLMHPGHIKHLKKASEFGDILIVTISPDIYVDKGPGRPVFNERIRAESLAALECVDYVAINQWPTAEKTIRTIGPDIYVKGQEFEGLNDKTGKLQGENSALSEIGGKLRYTHEQVFSSTKLIKKYFRR